MVFIERIKPAQDTPAFEDLHAFLGSVIGDTEGCSQFGAVDGRAMQGCHRLEHGDEFGFLDVERIWCVFACEILEKRHGCGDPRIFWEHTFDIGNTPSTLKTMEKKKSCFKKRKYRYRQPMEPMLVG
jgi:hypothetical protein